MKKLMLFSALSFLGWKLQAQVKTDSTRHPFAMDGKMYRRDAESLHNRHMRDFREGRYQAMNRFHRNSAEGSFRSFHRHRYGNDAQRIRYTPEQRSQVQVINDSYGKKSADLYKNDNLTLREYKSQLLILQKEKKVKLQGLLTAAQKDELANWKEQKHENAQVRDAALLERMRIRLQLSDEQTASISAQRTGLRTQIQSIHDNEDLLPFQKIEQIKALAAKQKESMKSVLTSDQYSQLESMHRQGWARDRKK